MIKTLELSLGSIGALSLLDPPGVGVPVVEPGVVLASGYYTEQTTGQLYYYDAENDQWYYEAAGLLYPLAISWRSSPSARIDLAPGDTLRLKLIFKYLGPQVARTFYAAIGNNSKSGSFGEWSGFTATKSMTIPYHAIWEYVTTLYVDIPIPGGGHQGEDGAAYCKIMDGFTLTEGENCTAYYYDVCHIVPEVGEFAEFSISKFEKV